MGEVTREEIYVELRQIKLAAVEAEVGWYNRRDWRAIASVDVMLHRLNQIREEMRKEAQNEE